ncbi:hypothetical protein Mame01_70010 [Microbispora amethystogenes]|nr:hypothetical protein Mame01_70010 [Microbispora amethystogenes]
MIDPIVLIRRGGHTQAVSLDLEERMTGRPTLIDAPAGPPDGPLPALDVAYDLSGLLAPGTA